MAVAPEALDADMVTTLWGCAGLLLAWVLPART